MSDICVIIPVKPTGSHKTRLSGLLSDKDRFLLFNSMLSDVITGLQKCPELANIVLVSSLERGTPIAQRHRIELLQDNGDYGLNGAVNKAARQLRNSGKQSILVLPGDLPLLKPDDISRLCSYHNEHAGRMVIVPDRHNKGTNALLVRPPDLFAFQYGQNSFQQHIKAAQNAGQNPMIMRIPSLSLDIDNPDDLDLLDNVSGHTGNLLNTAEWQHKN